MLSRKARFVQNEENAAKHKKPTAADSLSAGCSTVSLHSDATASPYFTGCVGGSLGSLQRSSGTNSRVNTPATTKTPRQPTNAASHPAAVRLKMIPRISPVITVPIARPLCSGGTSSGAIGTITCVTAEVVPITTEATASINNDGAAAATSMATPTAANSQVINPRRSATSPNGTNSRMPTA